VVSVDHQPVYQAADQRQPVVDLDVGVARTQLRSYATRSRIVSGTNRGGEDENPHGLARAPLNSAGSTGIGPELRRWVRRAPVRAPGCQYSLKLVA